MNEKLIITVDVGTTAVKIAIFTEKLILRGFKVAEYKLQTPGAHIVELNPEVYWNSVVKCIRSLVKELSIQKENIAVITCTTQGETIIPVADNGRVLHNAVVWLDSRADKESKYISARFTAEEFYFKTGCPEISPIWPISKILWFKNNKKEIYEKAYKFLLLEDYLIYKLSGQFITNPSVSCSTGFFDIYKNDLWFDILEYCGISSDKIPVCKPCGSIVGNISLSAAKELDLQLNTKISTGAMDQVASALGSGNVFSGCLTETTGTALVTAATCLKPELKKLTPVTVYCHAEVGKYLLINVSQTAGIILKWFRDEFCKDLCHQQTENVFAKMDQLASSAPIGSRGLYLFPHFTGMQIPVSDFKARGVFFGVGLDTGRECFIRAIMEGVGYMLRESVELLRILGVNPSFIYSLGGGAKSSVWNSIKANICNLPITTMCNDESTSVGAAILGGIACGIFGNIEEEISLLKEREKVYPIKSNVLQYEKGYMVYKQMYKNFKELF